MWRWVGWLAVGTIGAVVLVVAAGWLVLRSSVFQGYVRRTVQERAGAALGTEVKLGGLRLGLAGLSPSLDLDRVVVAGAEPYPTPPLLKAEHVHIGIQVSSLLRREWHVSELLIDQPVVNLREYGRGRTDVPQSLVAADGPNVFEIAVRHIVVRGGVVIFNAGSK
ncbi:MAG: hypothetical protein ACRD1L_13725, partial [Terriglobales bacterium]